jgi:hypothetical protein
LFFKGTPAPYLTAQLFSHRLFVQQDVLSAEWLFFHVRADSLKRQVRLHTFYKGFRKQGIVLCDVLNEDKWYQRGSTENTSTTDASEASV